MSDKEMLWPRWWKAAEIARAASPTSPPFAREYQHEPFMNSGTPSIDDLRLVFPDVKWSPDGEDVVCGEVEATDSMGHLHIHRFQVAWLSLVTALNPVEAIRMEVEIAKRTLQRQMPIDGIGMRRRGAVTGRLQHSTNPYGESTAILAEEDGLPHSARISKADRFEYDDADFAARLRIHQIEAARRRLNGD